MSDFICGAFGAFLYDVVLFWSKRFSALLLKFNLWQYLVIMFVYLPSAGLATQIYSLSQPLTPWGATLIGAGLPLLLSGGVAALDRAGRKGKKKTVLRGPTNFGSGVPHKPILGSLKDLAALI